jgi:hypothetical protein
VPGGSGFKALNLQAEPDFSNLVFRWKS